MNAKARRTQREERQGVVGLWLRMLGLLYRGAVVRGWDHFCAPETREVGFYSGIVGLDFFIFGGEGGCAKVVLNACR